MTINTSNDEVEVYQGKDKLWHWRRKDGANGKVVAIGAEGYVNKGYAIDAAHAYNHAVTVYTIET